MRHLFNLVLCLFVLCALPAQAGDSPFHGDLRQALTAEEPVVDHYTLDIEGLKAFYTARDFHPAWNFAGAENEAAFTIFVQSIEKTINYHGLQNEAYALAIMRKLAKADTIESRLQLEMLVADTLLRLAHDLHGDTIDLDPLYPGWHFNRAEINIPDELAKAVADDKVNELFERLTPKNIAYPQLARALQMYRDMATRGDWPIIEGNTTLRLNDRGPRVAQLRARLMAENYLTAMPTSKNKEKIFDIELRKAVETYQSRNGLNPDGNVGTGTLATLNIPLATRLDQIRANMERWRHMPDNFPPPRAVVVNIADALLDIIEAGHVAYRGPVIVGQVERKTPFIQSTIHSMIINPPWHVPAKIARADILPKLREDPRYLEKQGIVIRDSDYDPHGKTIDWKNISDEEFNFHLRQEPGKMNSLGRLKFDFNNDFAVYMHGTPHQELFKKNERALSSGCVRLRDPELVAQMVLAQTPGEWTINHIEQEISARKTRWIEIKDPLPIYILYWTVFTDETGQVQFRNDIYDYDRFLMESLKPGADLSTAPAAEMPENL